MRYVQAAVSDEEHNAFRKFAFDNDISISDLIEIAVMNYISITKRKEEEEDSSTSNRVEG